MKIIDAAPIMYRWLFEFETDPLKAAKANPCDDCAVVHGLYTEISDLLATMPKAVQDNVAARWFCHANRNRACRGNINNLRLREQEH